LALHLNALQMALAVLAAFSATLDSAPNISALVS
jgi:hypothetical protein